MNQSQKKLKAAIMILGILVLLSLAALAGMHLYMHFVTGGAVSAIVPDNVIIPEQAAHAASPKALASQTVQGMSGSASSSAESNETTILLYNRNPDDNTPFAVENMFPGDVITKDFRVHVSYKADVTVKFRAEVRDGYEKLAEVMMCRVELLTTGETVYDGLMRDFPESLDHALETDSKTTTELVYRITAYLDTSVGNEYQNQELVADYHWWVEEDENLSDNPDTGDQFNLFFVLTLMVGSAFVFGLLFAARKKEGNDA